MKKTVLVDMDGVLADIYTHFINYEYEESGICLDMERMHGKLETEAFPHFEKHVRSVGFFRSAPVIEHSVEGLKLLNDKYKILIVSSATEFPHSLIEKQEWMNEHFPFITWEQLIFCGRKDSIKGDIMIDDHIKNLNTFGGEKILFSQPHNTFVRNESFQRVNGWKDIIKKLTA